MSTATIVAPTADRQVRRSNAESTLNLQAYTPHMPKVANTCEPVLYDTGVTPVIGLPPATTPLMRKARKVTMTDMFAGGGGSSLGAIMAGVTPTYAFNHWMAAAKAHSSLVHAGAEDAGVYIVDLSDPTAFADQYATTTIAWMSPSCPPWSNARRDAGQARTAPKTDRERKEQLEGARAHMWSPISWLEAHPGTRTVIVENVVDLLTNNDGGVHRGWRMLPAWLASWKALGFADPQIVCFNSMFAGEPGARVPQSRDRLFFVFHRDGERAPDVRLPVTAECTSCDKQVKAVQVSTREEHPLFPGQIIGKYGRGYHYACPKCSTRVEPATNGVRDALDLTDLGTLVSARELGPTTRRRIANGLALFDPDHPKHHGYRPQPMIINMSYVSDPESKPGRPIDLPCPTLTARQELGLALHPDLVDGTAKPGGKLPNVDDMYFRMLRLEHGFAPEVARIGGFPDNYAWPANSKRDRWRLVGNAVTPKVAQLIIERVVAAL